MPFRKKVKEFLSRLGGGDKQSQCGKSAAPTPRPSTTDTVRPANSNVLTSLSASTPRPPPQTSSAPVVTSHDRLPVSVDSSYHPQEVLQQPPPLLRVDGESFVRTTSALTATTAASSDYDEHSTTNSLSAPPVPPAAWEGMSDLHRRSGTGTTRDGSDAPLPRHTSSPAATEMHVSSSIAAGGAPAAVLATLVTTDSCAAVVHTTVRPVVTEEHVQCVTREHHHHHVRTRILPVVDRHVLPTKYYLQFDPGNAHALREISAEEAKTYGEPVYQAEHIVAGDSHAEEVYCATTATATAPVVRDSSIPDRHLGDDGDGDETRGHLAAGGGVVRTATFSAGSPREAADKTDNARTAQGTAN